ncbi:unnamed protein product [Discosporangium mesarthrocarpum]
MMEATTMLIPFVFTLVFPMGFAQETFTFSVDLLAGPTGYFKVEGFDGIQPALTMVRGETYTFDQTDETNWYHPLGFAYEPDGAHEGVDELEEGVGNGDAPVYIINGNISDLDTYEPEFFYPLEAWTGSNYTVQITVTDPSVTEIFYFCHIHNEMSGRIHIVDQAGDEPAPPMIDLYEPYVGDDFDAGCGTFMSSPYQPKEGTFESELCPDQKFLCGDTESMFDRCMHAIDCKMNYEMRVEQAPSASNAVAFMRQMIPHHENAVNMAKVLLKEPGEELDPEVNDLLLEIINSQNAQITFMRGYLTDLGEPKEASLCAADGGGDESVPDYAIGIMVALGVMTVALLGTTLFFKGKSSPEKT